MARMPIPRRRSFPAGAMRPQLLCGISTGFPVLSPCGGQVAYALLTRAPVAAMVLPPRVAPRLACVKPAASVHPEPGSNSPLLYCIYLSFLCSRSAERPTPAVTRTSLTEGHALSQFPSLLTLFLSHYLNVLPRPGQGRTANLSLFSGTCKPRTDFFRRGAAFFRRAPPEDALRRLRLQRYELQSFPSKFFKHFFRENSRHQAQHAA